MASKLFKIIGLVLAFIARSNCMSTTYDRRTNNKIFPYKYQIHDLSNGLRVVIVPTDYPNIVSVQIPVQVGSRNEVEDGKTGFAHFFEHMMFRGTDTYTSEEYAAMYHAAGADYNAWTDDDMTCYHVTVLKEDLEMVLMLEADRFRNLHYTENDFKTESKAVLGEYNVDASDPMEKLFEVQRNISFTKHTYKHTTIGFLEDIMDMPNQFEHSKIFFRRFYRPERTILIVVGDVDDVNQTFGLVEKYWGDWKVEYGNSDVISNIPQDNTFNGPVYDHVEWQSPTLPILAVAFHGPAFSDIENDMATMDIISNIAFSSSSSIYQKLVIEEQRVDILSSHFPDKKDPYLLSIFASIKNIDDIWYVRDEIMKSFARLRTEKVSRRRLDTIKSNLRYSFANAMDSSQSIAEPLVNHVGLTRDPETTNKVYNLYDNVTSDDVMDKANKYFTDERLVIVTLAHSTEKEKMVSGEASIDKLVTALLTNEMGDEIQLESVLKRTDSPIVDFAIRFKVGSVDDPKGKEGLAMLTADMITKGSSRTMKYEDIQKALYPMATTFTNIVDKEISTFVGVTHSNNLDAFYEIMSDQLLNPKWDEADFSRIKSNLIDSIKDELKNDDSIISERILFESIFASHPYGHLTQGYIASLESMTLDDVKAFYGDKYTSANLILGMSGKFTDENLTRMKSDLVSSLPPGDKITLRTIPTAIPVSSPKALIIEKETISTTVWFGFPLKVTRSDPDFPALWLACTYLGGDDGRLYWRIREERGLNYGDYSYIEYGSSNRCRSNQLFEVHIDAVESIEHAHFATRIALFELNKLIDEGISNEKLDLTRKYLLKNMKLMVSTQSLELAYAMDSHYYGIGEFIGYTSDKIKKLTSEDVNQVIKRHLSNPEITFSFVTKDAKELRDRIVSETTSTLSYPSQKPPDLLQEDELIKNYKLDLDSRNVHIVKLSKVFQEKLDRHGGGSDYFDVVVGGFHHINLIYVVVLSAVFIVLFALGYRRIHRNNNTSPSPSFQMVPMAIGS